MQEHDISWVRTEMALAQPAPRRQVGPGRLGAQEPVRDAGRYHPDHPRALALVAWVAAAGHQLGVLQRRSGPAPTAPSVPRSTRAASSRTAGRVPAGPSSAPSSGSSCSAAIPIEERWRPILIGIMFVALLVPLLIPRVPLQGAERHPVLRWCSRSSPSSCWSAAMFGLPYVETLAVGRPAGHAGPLLRRHRRVAAARHPAGARPALEDAGRQDAVA